MKKLTVIMVSAFLLSAPAYADEDLITAQQRAMDAMIEAVDKDHKAERAAEMRAANEAAMARQKKEARKQEHQDALRAMELEERKLDVDKKRAYVTRTDEFIDRELADKDALIAFKQTWANIANVLAAAFADFLAGFSTDDSAAQQVSATPASAVSESDI